MGNRSNKNASLFVSVYVCFSVALEKAFAGFDENILWRIMGEFGSLSKLELKDGDCNVP